MLTTRPSFVATLAALGAGAALATPAQAETEASDPIVVTGSPASAGQTATKTDIAIFETPIAVQSVTAATLLEQGATSLDQALVNISGVATGAGGGADNGQPFTAIVIRGFGNDSHFRNGVRLDSFGSDSGTQAVQFANVESVDVLKGPAAILYGQVEPGGIVNIVTKQPLAKPAYAAEIEGGSHAWLRAVADATGPASRDGRWLYRLVGSWQDSGSPTQFLFNHTAFVAPSLAFVPSSADRITLEGEYRFIDEGQNFGYIVAPWNAAAGSFIPHPDNIATNYGETSPLREITWLADVRWKHAFSSTWSLTFQQLFQTIAVNGAGIFPSYLQNAASAPALFAAGAFPSGLAVGRIVNNVFDHDFTLSSTLDLVGHFTTGPADHTLLVGGDYVHFTYNGGINGIAQYGQAVDANGNDISSTTASYVDAFNPDHPGTAYGAARSPLSRGVQHEATGGAYVQDQVTLARRLHVLAGARLQWVRETQWFGFEAPVSPQPVLEATRVTPRIGALFDAARWLNLYANYAENFGASNGYGIQPNGQIVPPTSGKQWEVGAKVQSADKRLTASIAWYHLIKTNVPYPDPQNQSFSLVAGAERSQGLEIDVTGEPLTGWQIIANYAYTDAIVLRNAPATDTGGNPISTLIGPPGTPLGEVPRHLGHLWSTYGWQRGPLGGLKLGGGVTMHGAAPYLYSGLFLAPGQSPPYFAGWTTFDAMAAYGWRAGGRRLTVQINATNLFDKRYFTDVQNPGFGAVYDAGGNPSYGGMTALYGAPREVKASLRVEF